MRIGGIIWDAINIYNGIAVEVYFQGCTLLCESCHNPQFQSISDGEEILINNLIKILIDNQNWFDIISCLGGEPLLQLELQEFVYMIKKQLPDKKLWLFTGKEKEEIPKWCFKYFDVIKTGKYMKELPPLNGLASSNQKLLYKGKDY